MIDKIIKIEWDFFDKVNNEGGRAFCQDDYKTFEINRKAQFSIYSANLLTSYYQDLMEYKKLGINPIALKYKRIELLDKKQIILGDEILKKEILETIIQLINQMKLEFIQEYPLFSKGLRPNDNTVEETSFSNYLLGELSTYSYNSLILFSLMLIELIEKKENIFTLIETNIVNSYGYISIKELENKLKNK